MAIPQFRESDLQILREMIGEHRRATRRERPTEETPLSPVVSEESEWRRFELKEDLAVNSSAEAYIINSIGVTTSSVFTVSDLLGKISGSTGDKGYCRSMIDSGLWEILFPIECP